jgi:plasmid maintenance system antidote protein VapI
MTRYPYKPDYAVPPGLTLQETIRTQKINQRQLSMLTGLSTKLINQIINGLAPITPAIATSLEHATGIPTRMWNNLEANYQELQARLK